MSKILILTMSHGEGHNSAARALQQGFHERGVDSEIVDLFASYYKVTFPWSQKAYSLMVNRLPFLWKRVYKWSDKSTLCPKLLRYLRGCHRELCKLIDDQKPDAIVCTYPVYPWMLNELRNQGKVFCPHYTVITDAITINSLWFRTPSKKWFVSDNISYSKLRNYGISSDFIVPSGFPVSLALSDNTHDLSKLKPRVLFIVSSAMKNAREICFALLRHKEWDVTFVVPKDKELRDELRSVTHSVLGWTDKIPSLLMTHHAVITKAGGAIIQEAIAAHCPPLVTHIIPGQEEGNWELIRQSEGGALVPTTVGLILVLENLFQDNLTLWNVWKNNLDSISKTNATRHICSLVIQESKTPLTD